MKLFFKHIKTVFLALLVIGISVNVANSQDIRFGEYGSYTIELENIGLEDLVFQGPINSNSGTHNIELIDSKVLAIIGVKYLDIDVDISAEGKLLLDGNPAYMDDTERSIPFTLEAAFANNGENNISSARRIAIANSLNSGNTRFPILSRRQRPPGPPPTPPTGDFDQSLVNETAYLYFYGQIDVGNVVAGQYRGTITVTVEYR